MSPGMIFCSVFCLRHAQQIRTFALPDVRPSFIQRLWRKDATESREVSTRDPRTIVFDGEL
jgi:hypothetical protein